MTKINANDCYIEDRNITIEYKLNERSEFDQMFLDARKYHQIIKSTELDSLSDVANKFITEDNRLILLWANKDECIFFLKSDYNSINFPGYIITRDTLYEIEAFPIIEKIPNIPLK